MTNPVLSMYGISKAFGALQANNNISLDLKQGEIHALIGPNGAGKSTLINQIAGSIRPDSGTVFLESQDISQCSSVERSRLGLARTFQISSLVMDYSVLQNVVLAALGRRGGIFKFFDQVMHQADLIDQANAVLERVGLAKLGLERASELSHGQRRRIEIAMALVSKPKLFLMDEPMAGMGTEGTLELIPLLSNLRHQAPILLIEHDMDAIFTLADRISVLVYGEIIATGTVDEIRSHSEVRAAYLGDEIS